MTSCKSVLIWAMVLLALTYPARAQSDQNVSLFSICDLWGTNYTTEHGDLIQGNVCFWHQLLYNETFSHTPCIFGFGGNTVLNYPQDLKDKESRTQTIKAIWVYNLLEDTEVHSKVEVIEGGLGQQSVKIRMTSESFKKFKFNVQIYGW